MGGPARGIKKAIVTAVDQGIIKKKSEEQPKVQSQMDAPIPVSSPKGPTTTEIAEQDTLERKKRGRASTVLTSVTGASDPVDIFKKTLLGG